MKWHRDPGALGKPPGYDAGPYRVERVLGSAWRATGPHMDADVLWHTKVLAQDECRRAATRRAAAGDTCLPVVGDHVEVIDGGRRGVISAVIEGTHYPIYCVKFSRGKRLCLDRPEFKVVVP